MGAPQMPAGSRTKVFISYSHKDGLHLKALQTHLEPYKRAGIDVWDDTQIGVGRRWHEEIAKALQATKVAILLISAHFLASKFIAENELPPLLAAANEGGALILPVIVGDCNFSDTPLSRFQAANLPSKPLSRMRLAERDSVWKNVAKVAADALSGPLCSEQVKNAEAGAEAKLASGADTVLGDELDTLIALQETLRNAPKNTRFPYFWRPLGPLWATSDADLRKAQEIRRRILRMFVDEADKELAPDDKSSDRYHGYKAYIAYLRCMFDAEEWLRFENVRDTFEVLTAIMPELVPVLSLIPETEAECYEQEQIAVAHVRYDLLQLGVRYASAFPTGKQKLF